MDCRCSVKAFGVTLLHFKGDKINWGVIFTKKKLLGQMGNTHSGKPQKSLEKSGFPGIPGKFSSLNAVDIYCLHCIVTLRPIDMRWNSGF
jgi:hypothetical protein